MIRRPFRDRDIYPRQAPAWFVGALIASVALAAGVAIVLVLR